MSNRRLWLWLLMGIVVIAAALWGYQVAMLKSREGALRNNLATMRSVIKQYTADKRRPPQSLQDLVDTGYFRQLPIDPMTNTNSSWKPVIGSEGITDLHSGATSFASNGTVYNAW